MFDSPSSSIILRLMTRAGTAALLLAPVVLLACGDDGGGGISCTTTEECPDDQVCTGGVCVDSAGRSCRSTSDCGPNEVCTDSVCVSDQPDTGNDTADMGTPDATPDIDVGGEDTPPDLFEEPPVPTAPVIVSTSPEPDDIDVALDANVVVEWDQAMAATTFTPTNINVEDYEGNVVERRITYNAPTFEVTLSPVDAAGNFEPASPYVFTVAREVRAENELNPAEAFEMTFYTAGHADTELYDQLAEAYAPVVYAEVQEPPDIRDLLPRIDWFTALDFDGDLDVTNNLESLGTRAQTVPAHVYYNVLETETHFLVQYIFYYAGGVADDNDTFADAVEHDFAYSTVLVRKVADDPLGVFVLAEGLGDGQVFAHALSDYPSPCDGEGEPNCHGASENAGDLWVEFSSAELEPATDDAEAPGRRYPLYLSQATHASCLAVSDDTEAFRTGNRCLHNTDSAPYFFEDNVAYSRILRLGEGDDWTIDDEENIELTYTMSPFLEIWWTQRSNDAIWGDSRSYVPPGGAAGSGAFKLPSTLARSGEAPSSDSRAAPFRTLADIGRSCDGCSRIGIWFVDPVWEMLGATGHVTLDHEFSSAYCFNPFLSIDRRGEEGCEVPE